jgi:molecular chaperone GrpE
MLDEASKEPLIDQFRTYLESGQDRDGPPFEPPPGGELFSLFAELAALNSEVKRESRQLHEALDQFKAMFATLQSGYDLMARELERRRQDEPRLRRETLRPLLLHLLQVYDRLQAGIEVSLPARRSFWSRWRRRPDDLGEWLAAFREGQAMTLRRLDQILSEYQLRPVDALGQSFDPHAMRAVEVESRADAAAGVVTAELRKGFYWGEDLLRPAEVKVNRRPEERLE